MKIGIVTPGGFDRSGEERVIPVLLWLAERLARRHDVHVWTLYQSPRPDDFELCGAHVHNLGWRGTRLAGPRMVRRGARALAQEHRKRPFDVLHGFWASESGLIVALAGRLLHVPSVVSVAGGELAALPEIGYGNQLRWSHRLTVSLTLRLAVAVTAASEYSLRPVLQRRTDARCITLGVDTDLFYPSVHSSVHSSDASKTSLPGASCDSRSQPGMTFRTPDNGPLRLLHVASLNRVKDQPTLLRALPLIRQAAPNIHLDVVGVDTLDGAMQSLARELDLVDCVTFHGFLPSVRVADLARRSHLLLQSSRYDAAPVAVLEAGACAVPTVGTNVGHVADLAPRAARAVPVADPEAMSRAAIDLLLDAEARADMGQNALSFARARNADWTASQFEKLYSGNSGDASQSHRVARSKR